MFARKNSAIHTWPERQSNSRPSRMVVVSPAMRVLAGRSLCIGGVGRTAKHDGVAGFRLALYFSHSPRIRRQVEKLRWLMAYLKICHGERDGRKEEESR